MNKHRNNIQNSVIHNPMIMNLLYKEFSSRFCVLDFRCIKFEQIGFREKEMSGLLLTIDQNTKEYIAFLDKYDYPQLIANMLMYCELSENLKDACMPFISNEEFEHIKNEFAIVQKHLCYQWQDRGLMFKCSELFIDIVMYPLSQFHHEIIKALDLFLFIKKARPEMELFLQAESPSLYTQFSQFWVAEKLDMLNPNLRLVVI